MRLTVLLAALSSIATSPVAAQVSDAVLNERIRLAESNPTAENLLQASAAARLMRDYEEAERQWQAAWQATGPIVNGLINNRLLLAAASGEGVGGMQRAFREFSEAFNFSPIAISNWAGNYPEILWDGEFDAMVMRFSPEATDPEYRCGCYNTVAWVHRLAGRHDEARAAWARLVEAEPANIDSDNLDQSAQIRGQYARNLARAGRAEEARAQLRMSMDTRVSDEALPSVRRRWAQAYAELGDVQGAIEQLEPLLQSNSLITVHTLESRAAWMLVRDDPAFQAFLDRHR